MFGKMEDINKSKHHHKMQLHQPNLSKTNKASLGKLPKTKVLSIMTNKNAPYDDSLDDF
ncbi:MAG: hypothetical protein IPQ04_14365 [Saprospiraceae bacterium]|nr:hypothetical protein [Saprospiraceae bacterium]